VKHSYKLRITYHDPMRGTDHFEHRETATQIRVAVNRALSLFFYQLKGNRRNRTSAGRELHIHALRTD